MPPSRTVVATVATVVVLCVLGAACGSGSSGGSTTAPAATPEQPTEPPSPPQQGPAPTLPPPAERDVPYGPAPVCAPDDTRCAGDQTLDIYRSGSGRTPRPVAVWIHGGGFVSGDKAGVDARLRPLLDDGWDLVAIDYRLTTAEGDNRFPTPVRDAKRAIRWIRANADANGWDPRRIAAIGHSAGGNLVGMLAASAGDAELEPNDLPPQLASQSSAIAAGVALTPVSDLAAWERHDPQYRSAMRYLGCLSDCDFAEGSVPTYVTASNAPMLAVFGVDDQLAPPADGRQLADAYRRAGIGDRFEYVVVRDGPAMWRGHNPDLDRVIGQIRDFLDRWTGRG